LMPWRECSVTEERLRFVARLLDGEGMSEVCRDSGISRKTGYKIFNRYKDQGLERTRSLDAVEKVLEPSRLHLAHFGEVVAVCVQTHMMDARD